MILVSVPSYLVILFFYGVDTAWIVYSFFTPVLLIVSVLNMRRRQESPSIELTSTAETTLN